MPVLRPGDARRAENSSGSVEYPGRGRCS